MLTALLDTNVIMDMEDTGHPLPDIAADVLRRSHGVVEFFIHDLQLEDIGHDENEKRRDLLLSRIEQFNRIENPPEPTVAKFNERNWKCSSRNDFIDNALLLCVERHAVSFLVTNDKGILDKATQSGLRDRTLRLDEFGEILPNGPKPVKLAAVKNPFCYELDLNDPFFDSLRESYGGFNDWFNNRCCETQRKCWTISRNDRLAALCIYKDEQDGVITDNGLTLPGKTLKLCTFKVDESARGYKMGERLLYCAFRYAQKNGHTAVYFTTDETRQTSLVDLGHEFGFDKAGNYGRDAVYLKYMKPQSDEDSSLDSAEFIRRFYPSCRAGEGVGKYIVPIAPQWHERLFPDISNTRGTLFGDYSEFYNAEGNTIKKAYLSRSIITAPNVGDLLLFYRTTDRRAIDTIGIVVGAMRSTDVEEIVAITKRRTVYDPQTIKDLVYGAEKGLLIISFDLIRYFEDHPVTLAEMRGIGLGAPQTIGKLSDERFRAIMTIAR